MSSNIPVLRNTVLKLFLTGIAGALIILLYFFYGNGCSSTIWKHLNTTDQLELQISEPIILLYVDHYHINFTPLLYFAAWDDGTIIWGASKDKDNKDIRRLRYNEVEYFTTQLENEVFETVFGFLESEDFQRHPVRGGIAVGLPHVRLFLKRENRYHNFFEYHNFFVPSIYQTGCRCQCVSCESRLRGENWNLMVSKISSLRPDDGEKVDIKFYRRAFGDFGLDTRLLGIAIPVIVR